MKLNQGFRKKTHIWNLVSTLVSQWLVFLSETGLKLNQSLKTELHGNLQNEKVWAYSFRYSFKKYLLADFEVAQHSRVFLLDVKAENEWQPNSHNPMPDEEKLENWNGGGAWLLFPLSVFRNLLPTELPDEGIRFIVQWPGNSWILGCLEETIRVTGHCVSQMLSVKSVRVPFILWASVS